MLSPDMHRGQGYNLSSHILSRSRGRGINESGSASLLSGSRSRAGLDHPIDVSDLENTRSLNNSRSAVGRESKSDLSRARMNETVMSHLQGLKRNLEESKKDIQEIRKNIDLMSTQDMRSTMSFPAADDDSRRSSWSEASQSRRRSRRESISDVFQKPVEWSYKETLQNVQVEKKAIRVIHPFSEFRAFWDLLMGVFYFLLLWLFPVIVAYDSVRAMVLPVGLVTTAIFIADTIIVQLTQRVLEDQLPSQEKTIATTIILDRLGILADAISLFPFELLPIPGYRFLVLIHLLRTRHFPKLISKSQIFRQFRYMLEEFFNIGELLWALISTTVLLVILMHWEACMVWVMMENRGQTPELLIYVQIAAEYAYGFFIAVSNTFPLNVRRLHISMINEQTMFMVFTIVSAILYWLIIGTFSSLVMGIDPSGRIYRQKLDMVNEYLRFNRFPEAIRVKVRRYFRVKYQGKIFQEDLLNDLNRSMLQEIALFNCRGLIEKVDFLRRNKCDGRDELFLTELCMALISGYYIEDEIVFSAGEDGSDMYFIQTGKASVIVKGSVVAEMEDGSFFGEVSLITGAPRTATVKAKTRLLVYKLMQDDFNRILLQFPDVGLHIRETFKARMARLQKQSGAPPEAPPTKAEPPRVSIIETRHRSSVAT